MIGEGRTFATAELRGSSIDELQAAGVLPRRGSFVRALIVSRGDPRRYQLGLWMWGINRLAGLIVLLYVVVHVFTLLFVDGFYKTPAFGVVIVLTVGAVAFHGLNGLRLILGDVGVLTTLQQHRVASYVVVAASLLALAGTILRVMQGLA